jgi:hypothetical protein
MNFEGLTPFHAQKAMKAGTIGATLQAISKLPKRFSDGFSQGGWMVAITYVVFQLGKIWALTCGSG